MFKRSLGSKMSYLAQYEYSGGYGTVKSAKKVSDINYFVRKYIISNSYRGKNAGLTISSSLHGITIPMVDVDCEENLAIASMWLQENKIGNIIIESSPGHYWIFLDKTSLFFGTSISAAKMVPGIDKEYATMVSAPLFPHIVVRALKKDGFTPIIINNTSENDIVKSFCDQLIDHFQSQSPKLQWIERYVKYKDGKIDVSDPDTGTPLDVTLDDFL